MTLKGVLYVLVALWLLEFSNASKQKLEVKHDSRAQFFIENFGFGSRGHFAMTVTGFTVFDTKNKSKTYPYEDYKDTVFFFHKQTTVDASVLLQPDTDFTCPFDSDKVLPENTYITNDWNTNNEYKMDIGLGREGLYNLYFINCNTNPHYEVTFDLHLEQYNIDSNGNINYLSLGLQPLPTIYGIFSISYFVMFFVWVFGYMRAQGTVLNKIHYLMSLLIVLKFLSMLFYTIEQRHIKINGEPDGWDIAYYVFAVLKTGFFFIIVTLIGTGWSFFKPFLSDKDKKIIMVVIPLQILDNIALVIIGVDDPGSQGWFTWKDIFRLVDIICCGAVLIPIIWSIKHLREASQSDGKAARNLQKLHLFRQFYLIVVSYIYFTRIIIYLLDATLNFRLLYLGDVFTELATLAFFLVVGYKFRPISGNPYFKMEEDDAVRLEEMRNAELDN